MDDILPRSPTWHLIFWTKYLASQFVIVLRRLSNYVLEFTADLVRQVTRLYTQQHMYCFFLIFPRLYLATDLIIFIFFLFDLMCSLRSIPILTQLTKCNYMGGKALATTMAAWQLIWPSLPLCFAADVQIVIGHLM